MKLLLILLCFATTAFADDEAYRYQRFKFRRIDSTEMYPHYRYQLNVSAGAFFAKNGGLQMGSQFGWAPFTAPFYLMLEGNFTQYFPGSSFTGLGGLNYEFRINGAPKFRIIVGALSGVAFIQNQPPLPDVTWAAFANFGTSHEIDDNTRLQAIFRPGYLGGQFVFLLQFKVSFRFL
jgi:hypothetical protein